MVSRKIEEEVFLIYGVPRILICDNGVQYRSKRFQDLAAEYNVRIRFNAFYHAQANASERLNKTLKAMIAMYVADNHRKWDVNLSKVACAIRTARHEATRETPYFVNFGRRMVLSGSDHYNELKDGEEYNPGDSVRQEGFKRLFKDVRQRLEQAARRNERTYNLRRRAEEFLPGQMVWKKNFTLSDASKYYTSKLAPKYIGPFRIKKRVSPWTYELVDSYDKSLGIWNAKDLKPASADENYQG